LQHLNESPSAMVLQVLNNMVDRLRDYGPLDFENLQRSGALLHKLELYSKEYEKCNTKFDEALLQYKMSDPKFFGLEGAETQSDKKVINSLFKFDGATDYGQSDIVIDRL